MHRFVRCTYCQLVALDKNVGSIARSFSSMSNQLFNKPKESIEDFRNENPDNFGTIKKDINTVLSLLPPEKDDVVSFDIVDETGRKKSRTLAYYVKLIKNYINERKLVEAVDVLEIKMRNDRVQPNYYVYNLLINACATVGFSEKAFKLYNQMKKRGIKVTPATYTGLFNAYANAAPHESDTLERVNHLRELLLEKNYEPNAINYNAMIKAYGRCGDVMNAFCLVDEMITKQFSLKPDTFSFLLQACITDKEAGFRHALFVWRKMKQKFVIPDIYVYNLLLRCTRDCGLGDEAVAKDAIEKLIGSSLPELHESIKVNNEGTSSEIIISSNKDLDMKIEATSTELIDLSRCENVPNLLADKPHLGNIVALSEVKRPEDRILLLGGYQNILNMMKADKVKPENKTFSILLEIVPSTVSVEKKLMQEMKTYGVEIDVKFCNILIKKRSLRCDYENARDVLKLLQSIYITPDIMTFGALAISCRNLREAASLIDDMKSFGYRLNTEILGAMLQQACYHINFEYIMFLMKYSVQRKIRPNDQFLEKLEEFKKRVHIWKRARNNKNKHRDMMKDMPKFINESWFVQGMRMFMPYYEQWIKSVQKQETFTPRRYFKKNPTEEAEQTSDEDESEDITVEPTDRTENGRRRRRNSFEDAKENNDDSQFGEHNRYILTGVKSSPKY